MPKITFNLIHDNSNQIFKSFKTLKDCIKYIRLQINDSRKYSVEELEDNDMTETCSAYYLLEKYKDLDKLPVSLSDC